MPISKVTTGSISDSVAIDTDTLVVDGVNNRVGVGTSSPSYKTEISDGTVTFGVNPLSAYSTVYAGTTTNHGMNLITNGNSRLNITSGGLVTMPYQPFALVDFGGGSYGAMSGIAPFDNIAQSQGNHYNTSTYKFTCPVAGVYMVTAKFLTQNTTDVGGVDLYLNGVSTFRSYTVYRGLGGTFILKCAANDVLHLNIPSLSYYQDVAPNRYSWASYQLMY